jgi:serine/threonine protein kinase
MRLKTVVVSFVLLKVIQSLCKSVTESKGLLEWLKAPNAPIAHGAFSFVFKAEFAFDENVSQKKTYALKYIKTEKSEWIKPKDEPKEVDAPEKDEKHFSPKEDIATHLMEKKSKDQLAADDGEFKQEIESLDFLSKAEGSNSHIVSFYGCFALGKDRILLVQDLLSETVDQRIMSDNNPFKKLPLSLLVRFMAEQILDHLAFMHNAGMAHCDFKGENLMFVHLYKEINIDDQDEQMKMFETRLIDFGFASKTFCGDQLSWWGTPGFMPPESFNALRLRPGMHFKQDIFAAGITMIDVLERQTTNSPKIYDASRTATEFSFKQPEEFAKVTEQFKETFIQDDGQAHDRTIQKTKIIDVLYQMIHVEASKRPAISTSSMQLKEIAVALRQIEEIESKSKKILV